LLPLEALHVVEEREDLELDVRDECGKCGAVLGVLVPAPPPEPTLSSVAAAAGPAAGAGSSRVFVSFGEAGAAAAARRMMHGRIFDSNVVTARFVGRGAYEAAARGEWPTLLA
jgi:splicing factor U2AF subunit